MRHFASPAFWDCYDRLPTRIQRLADENFALLKAVRVGLGHRALARDADGDLIWFWTGTHSEYDRIVGR